MSNFRFENGKSDADNLAGMLDNIYQGFNKTVSIVAGSKNKPDPMNNKISMVIALGMANGIGIMCSMNGDTVIKGFKQYLSKCEEENIDGMFDFIVELSNNPRYAQWIERGGLTVRDFMEGNQGEASMLQLAIDYFDARD